MKRKSIVDATDFQVGDTKIKVPRIVFNKNGSDIKTVKA